jgi:hypothetical protein
MIARVAVEHRNSYALRCEDGTEIFATLAGKLRHEASHRELLPAGLRQLQPWAGEGDVDGAFPDIEELAGRGRLRSAGRYRFRRARLRPFF